MTESSPDKEFLFDIFIDGYKEFVDAPMNELMADGSYVVGTLNLKYNDYFKDFRVYSVGMDGGLEERGRLIKPDNRAKFNELKRLFKAHEVLVSKKKEISNFGVLKRFAGNEAHLPDNTEYFIFRPDATCETVRYYTDHYAVNVYFVDKKTHALYLLEEPKFFEWYRERHKDD